MRVALVNALSYPGFVSGATLQVHRVAVALAALGHDVALFSGARRAGASDLAVEHETADGITVTTINTEDHQGFANRLNYNNPGASAALLLWLADFRPDVVHAHALQGLGAGWIDDAAKTSSVVVTMHDWWWICARQFLVTEDLTIDAPLVDVDGCPCSGGVAFNQERRSWLAARLDHVTTVLVPSSFMRDSLLVNGFEPARVTVDTNGVDRPQPGISARAIDNGPPHLGFVGGEHDFKGFPLLVEARRRLPDAPVPLRISCWGAGGSVHGRHLPPGMEVLPAYSPERTSEVMRGLDALAVPSLMRESFSIVTREALLHGVPVITSDCGGPEEAVVDGENGLVVESGSPAAWSAALARWASDPGLRRRLRDGAATFAAGPQPADQAAHLAAVYAGLGGRRATTTAG